jgi:hypothetical protein
VYDDAVVAVTADHGVAFVTGQHNRATSEASQPEVMWTPLLVKAPGQHAGAVSDANLETMDIVPTIAALAGIDIPWRVDGVAAGSPALVQRGDAKRFRRFKNEVDTQAAADLVVDGADGFARMLGVAPPPLAAGDDPVAGLYRLSGRPDLAGASWRPSGRAAAGAVTVDDRDRLAREERPVLAVSGVVETGAGTTHVVASAGGRIVAISPLVRRADGRTGFALLLPGAARAALDGVALGLVQGTGSATTILDAGPLLPPDLAR